MPTTTTPTTPESEVMSVPELDVDLILERVLPVKLVKIFKDCNNISAARAAAEQLEKLQDQIAIDRHKEAIASLTEPIEIAHYYGRLELPRRDLRAALGRDPQPEEAQAYQKGRRDRASEMRALEMHRAQRGHRIEPWMTRC